MKARYATVLYHVSPAPGIRVLRPGVSSHGKAYVYAIDNMTTALLFGAPHDDFDLMLDADEAGRPEIHECYPDAFRTVYQGRRCSLYEVDETPFRRGVTGWEPELVCETEVSVLRETPVEDLYALLQEREAQGELLVLRYRDEPDYKRRVAEHVVDRLIRFDLLERFETADPRGQRYYGGIVSALRSVMDGHLL